MKRYWAVLLFLGCGCTAPSPVVYQGRAKLETLHMQPGQALKAQAEDCGLTMEGDFARLQLEGKGNFCELKGRVPTLVVEGQGNRVQCSHLPNQIRLRGEANEVLLPHCKEEALRPQLDIQGNNQAIRFLPP